MVNTVAIISNIYELNPLNDINTFTNQAITDQFESTKNNEVIIITDANPSKLQEEENQNENNVKQNFDLSFEKLENPIITENEDQSEKVHLKNEDKNKSFKIKNKNSAKTKYNNYYEESSFDLHEELNFNPNKSHFYFINKIKSINSYNFIPKKESGNKIEINDLNNKNEMKMLTFMKFKNQKK